MFGIYKIQSIIKPDKIYIGSAIDIFKRWNQHLYKLKKKIHVNKKLQYHFDKYNESDLWFSIILYGCNKNELIIIEQLFLDSYKPWFNICKIAGSTLGIKASEESKQKMRKAQKGKVPWSKGKHLSESHKQKISKSKIGENNPMYGVEPWNKGKKGLQKMTGEMRKNISNGVRKALLEREQSKTML